MTAPQSLVTPRRVVKTLHPLVLNFSFSFILLSSEVLANLDQKPSAAQSPRLIFYVISSSRLSWYQCLGQFSHPECPYFLWSLALSVLNWNLGIHLFFFLNFRILFIFLYSRFLLVIHFIHVSIYMSIPISQFIPPPRPTPQGIHLLYILSPIIL